MGSGYESLILFNVYIIIEFMKEGYIRIGIG
jgi:hypothetical protein